MLRTCRVLFVLVALIPPASCTRVYGQTPPSANQRLLLNAALVLTPEFCASKIEKQHAKLRDTFDVGRAACAELEPALRNIFSNLTRVGADPTSGDAQVVLLPKFVNTSATMGKSAFSSREMVLLLEWTVKDRSGKTVWLETVQGSARHSMGNAFTMNKNLDRMVQDAMKDAAEQSASKMCSSQELQKVASRYSTSGD